MAAVVLAVLLFGALLHTGLSTDDNKISPIHGSSQLLGLESDHISPKRSVLLSIFESKLPDNRYSRDTMQP